MRMRLAVWAFPFAIFYSPVGAEAEVRAELPTYCEASQRSTASMNLVERRPLRGISSIDELTSPASGVELIPQNSTCSVFRQKTRDFALASMAFQKRKIELLFPSLKRTSSVYCSSAGPKVEPYLKSLDFVLDLTSDARSEALDSELPAILTDLLFFKDAFPKYNQALKEKSAEKVLPQLKRDLAFSKRHMEANHVPKDCTNKCSPLQKQSFQRYQRQKDRIEKIEKKSKDAAERLKDLKPLVFKNPIFLNISEPFSFRSEAIIESQFAKKALGDLVGAMKIISEPLEPHNRMDLSAKYLEVLQMRNQGDREGAQQESMRTFETFMSHPDGKTLRQVALHYLKAAYEKSHRKLSTAFQKVCFDPELQDYPDLSAELLALAPAGDRPLYEAGHCDCLLNYPPSSAANSAQIALGLAATGVGLAGAVLSAPALAVGALVLGTGVAATSAIKTVRARNQVQKSYGLEKAGKARSTRVAEEVSIANGNLVGTIIDLALLPIDGLAAVKAIKNSGAPASARTTLRRTVPSKPRHKILGIRKKHFAKFSQVIRDDQLESLMMIAKSSKGTAKRIAKRIAKQCQAICSEADIDDYLKNNSDFLSFPGVELTDYGKRIVAQLAEKSMSLSTAGQGIAPQSVFAKMAFIEKSSIRGGRRGIDFFKIMGELEPRQRRSLLGAIDGLNFAKGLTPYQVEKIADLVTQLKFFRKLERPYTLRSQYRYGTDYTKFQATGQALEQHALKSQLQADILAREFHKTGKFYDAGKWATQNRRFRSNLSGIMRAINLKATSGLLRGPISKLSQKDFDRLLDQVLDPNIDIRQIQKEIENRPDLKAFLDGPAENGTRLALWLTNFQAVALTGVLTYYAYDNKEFASSIGKYGASNYSKYRRKNSIPSRNKISSYNCVQLIIFLKRLEDISKPGDMLNPVYSRAYSRANDQLRLQSCKISPIE